MADHPGIETHTPPISNEHRALGATSLGYAGLVSGLLESVPAWSVGLPPKNKKSRFGAALFITFLLLR